LAWRWSEFDDGVKVTHALAIDTSSSQLLLQRLRLPPRVATFHIEQAYAVAGHIPGPYFVAETWGHGDGQKAIKWATLHLNHHAKPAGQ
jgi:hypothetical protein